MIYFLPLLLSPVFLIELLIAFTFCGVRKKLLFFSFVALSIFFMFALSFNAEPNRAVWSTATGFVLHTSLRPRALLPGTVVVQTKASALNPVDYKVVNHLPSIPFVRWVMPQATAIDVAGVVVDTKCPERFQLGDEIFGFGLGGTQEYTLMACSRAGKIPRGVSFENAAAASTAMFTAQTGLRELRKDADTVVVIGASGGCGLAGVMLAKQRGVKNILCVSSRKNHEVVMQHGCTKAYDYTAGEKFFDEILGEWKGKVDLIYDTVSALNDNPYFPRLVNLLEPKQVGGATYERFNVVQTQALPEDVAEMESNPALFNIKLALVLDALNVANMERAFQELKTHHAVGKIVLTIGDQHRKRG